MHCVSCVQIQQAALMHEEGTRLLEAMSAHYPDVHVALLPSALLLGPNAMKERRAARSDGADSAIVTIGSLQKALRTARVVVGDSGKRIVSCIFRAIVGYMC